VKIILVKLAKEQERDRREIVPVEEENDRGIGREEAGENDRVWVSAELESRNTGSWRFPTTSPSF
jgi:hypothetical protein